MSDRVFNVLFLCTGNSARSIMAEAILRQLGHEHFRAFSAGSHPTGKVSPLVLELLTKQRLPTEELRSKSWDEFAVTGAPQMDFIFTVCDKAAGEVCPAWPGQPMTAQWGIEDPAAIEGNDEAKRQAVIMAFRALTRRVSIFVCLPFARLDAIALKREIDDIGKLREKGE